MCILLIKDAALKKMRRGSGLEAVGFSAALPSAIPFFSKPPAKDAAKWGAESVASPPRWQEDYYCYYYFTCMNTLLECLCTMWVGAWGPWAQRTASDPRGLELWVLRIEPGSSETTASALNWHKSCQSAVRLPHLSSAPSSLWPLRDRPVTSRQPPLQPSACQCSAQRPASPGPTARLWDTCPGTSSASLQSRLSLSCLWLGHDHLIIP